MKEIFLLKITAGTKKPLGNFYYEIKDLTDKIARENNKVLDIEFRANEGDVDVIALVEVLEKPAVKPPYSNYGYSDTSSWDTSSWDTSFDPYGGWNGW